MYDSEGTAKSSYKYLRAVLRAAYRDGLLSREPCVEHMEYRKAEGGNDGGGRHVWDVTETVTAWILLRGAPLEAYVLLASGAGLRREEALALDWSDVEFKTLRRRGAEEIVAWVEVVKAVTEEDGEKGTKNKHSSRRVPICGYPARRLLEIRGEGPVARTGDGRRLVISGFRRQWWNMWKPAREVRYSRSKALRSKPSGPLVFETDSGEGRELTRRPDLRGRRYWRRKQEPGSGHAWHRERKERP